MQQIPFIELFKSALHVSGDKLAHPQEHFLTVYTAQKCSWGWASLLPETCRADLKRSPAAISVHCTKSPLYTQKVLLRMGEFVAHNMYSWFKKINKRNLLHLVGCLRRTSTCFGRIIRRYTVWILIVLFWWLSVVRTTDSHLKRTISTNFYIYTVYLLMIGYRYSRNTQRFLTKYTEDKLFIKLVFFK